MNGGFRVRKLKGHHTRAGLEVDGVNAITLEHAVEIHCAASPGTRDDRNAIAVLVNIRTGGTRFGAPEAWESYNVCASRDRNSWHASLVAVPGAAWAREG